jgi:hypothetical protein
MGQVVRGPAGPRRPPPPPPEAPTEVTISQLAREIAREIVPFDAILKKFKLDTQTYDRVFDMPFFQRRLEEELAVWNGSDSGSIKARVAAKAATVIEESLMEVFDLVHDKSQPLSGKVEALKFAAKLASMGEGAQTDPGEKVIFNISIGNTQLTFEAQRDPKVIEGEAIDTTEPAP